PPRRDDGRRGGLAGAGDRAGTWRHDGHRDEYADGRACGGSGTALWRHATDGRPRHGWTYAWYERPDEWSRRLRWDEWADGVRRPGVEHPANAAIAGVGDADDAGWQEP